jgi:cycloeucalenol cycloisomerase
MPAVASTMSLVLLSLSSLCLLLYKTTPRHPSPPRLHVPFPFSLLPVALPPPGTPASSHDLFCFRYSLLWMSAFFLIVALRLYEAFTHPLAYLAVCGSLSLPVLLCPFFLRRAPPERGLPFYGTHSFRATLFLVIYSHIGNYWYTHYFYSVLEASYTMPAVRLNDVPACMYFATLFYFSSYHAFSNAVLRYISLRYPPSSRRLLLFCAVVFSLSYFTAFMETLTISAFPYYSFADRDRAYTVGSLFYGLYFLVSFPAYYTFQDNCRAGALGAWDAALAASGVGMIILCLLDAVRLGLGMDFVMRA